MGNSLSAKTRATLEPWEALSTLWLNESERLCRSCHVWKDVSEFYYWPRGKKSHRETRCKACRKAYGRQHYHDNPGRNYASRIKREYGVGLSAVAALQAVQGGKCAICRDTPTYRLHIDHDHKTGRVRGLLCQPCNTAIGKFRENTEYLQAAILYLQRANSG